MKNFKIILHNGDTYEVNGILVIPNEGTNQSVIYSKNDPTIQNIVAVVPANALIIVEPQKEK
jgi:hypothetical protein